MEFTPHSPHRLLSARPARIAGIAIVLVTFSAVLAAPVGAKSEQVIRAPSGVTYVTGGAGSEAVELLRSMERDFNLKLVFADTTGAYLGDVKVTIVAASGQVVLDATSEGPLLMAKLPAGAYQIEATSAGHAEHRKTTIAGNKLITVDFRWAPI